MIRKMMGLRLCCVKQVLPEDDQSCMADMFVRLSE